MPKHVRLSASNFPQPVNPAVWKMPRAVRIGLMTELAELDGSADDIGWRNHSRNRLECMIIDGVFPHRVTVNADDKPEMRF